jgi:hypothetical protein
LSLGGGAVALGRSVHCWLSGDPLLIETMKRTTQSTALFPGRCEVAAPGGADRVRELCFILPALVAASSAEPAKTNQKY